MPENSDVVDECANMALLLLSWILECQDAPLPQERGTAAIDRTTFAVAWKLSEQLLKRAEEHGTEHLTAPVIRAKFASMISAGARTADGGDYAVTAKSGPGGNCVESQQYKLHCVETDKWDPVWGENLFTLPQ